MFKKVFSYCAIFSFFALNTLFGQILQYENQIVAKVDVIVHTSEGAVFDSAPVLARLKTQQGRFFSQTTFDEDLKLLAQDFDRVEPCLSSAEDQVVVKIELWPKPLIRSIQWHGAHLVKVKRLIRELNIEILTPYERQAFNEAFHKLKAYYLRKGFFEARLDYQILPVPDSNMVDIIIDIEEGRSGKIQDIVFVNFSESEEYEVLKMMMTQKYNLFTSWYTGTGTYNEEGMQQDRFVIINYLQNQGYADAQVTIDVTQACAEDRITIIITADKGERYYFGDISFEGNCVIPNEQIACLFTIQKDTPFSLETIRENIEFINDAYGRIGYIDVVVDFEPELKEDCYYYNVHFKIEEGEQFRVGMIRVFGNSCTKTSVILHETLLTPGEIFNNVKLKATEERLRNIGYFKNVNAYIAKGTESSHLGRNYRDVYIEVEETNTGQFSAFLGYSSVEEIFGGLTITERNFNHEGFYFLGRDGLKALRGGGEYLSLTTQIGQKSRNYVLSWTKPFFYDTKWTVGFDLGKNSTRYISNEYDLDTIGLNLRAHYDLNQFMRVGVHYRLSNGIVYLHNMKSESSYCYSDHHHEYCRYHSSENNSPSNSTPCNSSQDDSWKDQNYCYYPYLFNSYEELRREARIHGLISAIGTSLTYDSTNHPLKPNQGFRSKLFVEYAGLGGDHQFLTFGYLNSYFYPIGSRNVIRYRADFRFIQPVNNTRYEDLPLDERIFLGGEFMVRGYRPYRLGPRYHMTDIPRGGISLQLYSIEFTRRVMKDLYVFTFFDAGQLSKDVWEFGRLSASLGYGARIKLIPSIPEITLGMGYPINPKDRSDVKKFFISLGGNF